MTSDVTTYRDFDAYYTDARASIRSGHPDFHVFRLNELGDELVDRLGPFKTAYYQFALGNSARADLNIYHNYRVSENYSLVMYLPGQIIRWKKTGQWDGYVANAKEHFFQAATLQDDVAQYPFLHSLDPIVLEIERDDFLFLSQIYELMLTEYAELTPESLQVCRHLLQVLIISINRIVSTGKHLPAQPDVRYREIASAFKSNVIRHYLEHRSVGYYARLLGVSSAYLGEAVKKVYNTSPKQLINEIIFLHAKTMLQTTSQGVKEVAYSLNFDDYSHFVKFFRKMGDVSPAEFRKNAGGQT